MVSTLRCGRNNPSSNPGHGSCFYTYSFRIYNIVKQFILQATKICLSKICFLYIESWYKKNGSMNYVLFSSSLLSCMPLKDLQRTPTIQSSNVVAFIDTENRNTLRFIYFYPVHTFIFSFSCFAYHYRYPSKVAHFHFTRTIVKQSMICKLYQRNTKLF